MFQGHPFHLVSPSPWPIFTCVSLLTLTTSGVLTMHNFQYAGNWLPSAFALLIASMFLWFRDVISEGTYLGNHTLAVQRGLNWNYLSSSGVLKAIGLSFNRKSPSGFGIRHTLLTLRWYSMAFSFFVCILLRILDSISHLTYRLLGLYGNTNLTDST